METWAVVLAGGEGVRLRAFVRRTLGEERPKQFCRLLGPRSLLRQTLDRVALLVPPDRTVVVGVERHAPYLAAELGPRPASKLLKQPESRGTAAAVLLAAQWIAARDPRATIAFFPSDHFIREEARFMQHVADAARFIGRERGWMVLLGVPPSEPEPEYGWIDPGERITSAGRVPIYRVRRFLEKPSPELARALFRQGCLWNTLVFVTEAGALLASGRACVPGVAGRLGWLSAFWDGDLEEWAVRQAYALAPTANFSRAVLEACAQPVAVLRVSDLTWCDLGSPDRVRKTLARSGMEVPRLATTA